MARFNFRNLGRTLAQWLFSPAESFFLSSTNPKSFSSSSTIFRRTNFPTNPRPASLYKDSGNDTYTTSVPLEILKNSKFDQIDTKADLLRAIDFIWLTANAAISGNQMIARIKLDKFFQDLPTKKLRHITASADDIFDILKDIQIPDSRQTYLNKLGHEHVAHLIQQDTRLELCKALGIDEFLESPRNNNYITFR